MQIVESLLSDPDLRHVSFDIRGTRSRSTPVASPESIQRIASVLIKYPDRVLFGTDTVAPAGPKPYFAVFDMWTPVWRLLTTDTSVKVRKGNSERIFDEAHRKVRAWEKTNMQ